MQIPFLLTLNIQDEKIRNEVQQGIQSIGLIFWLRFCEDSVLIYSMEHKWIEREVIGVERGETGRII